MRLKDPGTGMPRDSIACCREHRHRLGDTVEATVRFPGFEDPHNPYLMMLRDPRGNELLLSGCTAGYAGEGPRGAVQVLVESGWPPDQAALVFTTAVVHLERDADAGVEPGSRDVRTGRTAPQRRRRRAWRVRHGAVVNRAGRVTSVEQVCAYLGGSRHCGTTTFGWHTIGGSPSHAGGSLRCPH